MKEIWISLCIFFLVVASILILQSVAPTLFPLYYLFIGVGIIAYFVFSRVDFEIYNAFSKAFYVGSIIFLALPLLIGQVTRGAVRWIAVGDLTIQPSELVRPFLLVFFANYLAGYEVGIKKILKAIGLLLLPLVLILLQPSLGVAFLTGVGFVGILLASTINKKAIFAAFGILVASLPLLWFLLAPYQKERVIGFLQPQRDPAGAGYNSIQSMIAVGSGKFTGRGLGEGVQTQLDFLPERQTDFIFASIAEEMGFVGAGLVLLVLGIILWRVAAVAENSVSVFARAYIAGFFLTILVQVFVHVGMNMGLMPITGVPLPLVSAGGSSFIATMVGLGMVVAARKKV